MLRKIPVAGLQGRARFVWGSHQNKARPRSNLAVTDEAIRTMEALRLPEAYRAKRRLAATGAGDFYGEEDFIGDVAYIVGTTQHSLPLVPIRSSHGYMKAFSVHRYPSSLDIIKTTTSNDKSHYSSNCIPRYLPTYIV